VESSARLHVRQLQLAMTEVGLGAHARRGIDALLRTIEAALAHGAALTAADVPISAHVLSDIPAEQRGLLVNQATPGLGRDDAAVLVMGTEHAYDVADPGSIGALAVEGCGLAVLWLCGSRPEIIGTMGGGTWVDRGPGPFHIYANDYHRVLCWRAGNHTWKCLSKVLAWARGEEDWRRLLEVGPGHTRLGDLAYQIELSARPSLRAATGAVPSASRTDYLRDVVATLRETARVLLFHGAAYPEVSAMREDLGRVFLGLEERAACEQVTDAHGIGSMQYDGERSSSRAH